MIITRQEMMGGQVMPWNLGKHIRDFPFIIQIKMLIHDTGGIRPVLIEMPLTHNLVESPGNKDFDALINSRSILNQSEIMRSGVADVFLMKNESRPEGERIVLLEKSLPVVQVAEGFLPTAKGESLHGAMKRIVGVGSGTNYIR